MKSKILLLATLATSMQFGSRAGAAEGPRPLSAGLQLGGNSFLYALNVDYDFTYRWRFGGGLSGIKQFDLFFFQFRNYFSMPLHADFTFLRRTSNSFYLSTGLTYLRGVLAGGLIFDDLFRKNPEFQNSSFKAFLIPLGLGWEYRSDGGFNFRLATYTGPMAVSANSKTKWTFVPPYLISLYFGWTF